METRSGSGAVAALALGRALDLELIAILTETDAAPDLAMERPALGAIEPSVAFGLFADLRAALAEGVEVTRRQLAGFDVVLIGLAGPTCLVALGARTLSTERASILERFGHDLRMTHGPGPAATPLPFEILRLSTAEEDGIHTASVSLASAEQVSHGSARDPAPLIAVAQSVLAAVGTPGVTLQDAVAAAAGDLDVILVTLTDAEGRRRLAAVEIASGDRVSATAQATIKAACGG